MEGSFYKAAVLFWGPKEGDPDSDNYLKVGLRLQVKATGRCRSRSTRAGSRGRSRSSRSSRNGRSGGSGGRSRSSRSGRGKWQWLYMI